MTREENLVGSLLKALLMTPGVRRGQRELTDGLAQGRLWNVNNYEFFAESMCDVESLYPDSNGLNDVL